MAGGRLERLLIRRVQKLQDRNAAGRLIEAYYNEIYAYVFRQTGEKELAMDLTQNIFVAMLHSVSRYDPDKASFRTWLYRIASHKIIDWFRSGAYRMEQRKVPIAELFANEEKRTAEQPADGNPVEESVITEALAGQILESLREKEPVLEEIFRLKFYGGATFEEIGRILGMPPSTVKTRYYSALKDVRKEFSR